MNIKILSDSTCDLPQELLDRYNITLIPLLVIKDGQALQDNVQITPEDIFQHVAAGGDLCSTAALSVGEYMDHFAPYAPNYDAVIHVSLGSSFSSCYQNACLAADEYDNVTVIDSRNLCNGQGLVVLKVAELAQTASCMEDILEPLEEFLPRVEISFLVDKLDYLVKGGRCSAVAALGANLLSLKPCIEVRDGKLIVVKKYRGSFDKCLTAYARERLTNRDDLDGGYLILPRTVQTDAVARTIMTIAEESGNFRDMWLTYGGCTICCHCGPGALGLALVRK